MKVSREIKTAILVLAGLTLIVYTFNYLKGKNLLESSRKVYAVYDNVEGLVSSSPVTINGHNVGRVQEIKFTKDGSGKLSVLLMVEDDYKFSKNSKAELYEAGLIGGKAIAIVPAFDGAPNTKSGDTLQGVIKAGLSELVNRRLTPLQEKIEKMMVSADSLLTNINSVFDSQTKSNLKKSIAQLEGTLSSFKNTSASLNDLIVSNQASLDSTLKNVNRISGNLSKVSDSLASANLKSSINELEKTLISLNKVVTNIESGKGSLGKLANDEKLYNNLEAASKQLEELLQDFKLNPKRYVHFSIFGKKAEVYDAEGNEIKENNTN